MQAVARADNPVAEAADRLLTRFKRPATLLIAVSGGSDSTGLLVALATQIATGLYPQITLAACTVDHALREGSAEEVRAVAALCARHGIAHIVRRWEGLKPQAGLQAAARTERYRLLVDAARTLQADVVLSAHTRDDQAETIAMRAARSGEGIGLSGMADAVLLDGAVWLLRPFLGVDRSAIRAFLSVHGEVWTDDPSNANPRFERARIREEAERPRLPEAGDRAGLAQRAAAFLSANICREGAAYRLRPEAVESVAIDPAAWRGLLMLAAATGGRVHGLEARAAERLRAFLASGTLSRLTAGRVVFDRRRDGLHLYREFRGIAPLILDVGEGGVWDGRYLVLNRSGHAITVSALGERAGMAGTAALRGVARRAGRAAPVPETADGGQIARDAVDIVPRIAPYAHFLPGFDLPLAQALAALVGRSAFPLPPNE